MVNEMILAKAHLASNLSANFLCGRFNQDYAKFFFSQLYLSSLSKANLQFCKFMVNSR